MSSNLYGSILGLIGIILALSTHMIIKELTHDVDFLVIIFGRFVFSLPLLFLFAFMVRNKNIFQVNNWKNVLLRTFFGLVSMMSVFLSLQLIPIALVTALAQSSAIFVTLLAPVLIGEKIGLIRWMAVIIGLLGVYLTTNPIGIIMGTNNLSSIGLMLATFSAVSLAGLALTLRKLGKTEEPTTTALIHNLITSFVIVFLIVFYGTKTIGVVGNHGIDVIFYTNSILFFLIFLGIMGSFVQYFMTSSYKFADATILVTIRYLAIPLSAIFGYYIWDETLSFNQISGGILIIFSCLIITFREIKLNV